MNKVVKFLGLITIVIVMLLGIGTAVLIMKFPKEKIIAMVSPDIEKALGREVTISDAGISFFPIFGLNVGGVEIANTTRPGYSKDPFLKLNTFLISISVPSLFRKKLNIKAIILDHADILIEIGKDGSYNFDDLAVLKKDTAQKSENEISGENKKAQLPIPLTLEKMIIKESRIRYLDYKSGMQAGINSINQEVSITVDKKLENLKTTGEMFLGGISFLSKDIAKPIEGVRVSIKHDVAIDLLNSKITLNSIKASLQKVSLLCSGTIENFDSKPDINLSISTDEIAIEEILSEIPVEMVSDIKNIQAKGTIKLNMDIAGRIEENKQLKVAGNLVLSDGYMKYSDLPKAISNIDAMIGFTDNSLDISKLNMKLGNNPLALKMKLNNFKMPNVVAKLQVDFNLNEIKDFAKLPKGVFLGGHIEANVSARGVIDPDNPDRLDLKGKINAENVKIISPPLTKPILMNGWISLSTREIIENLNISIGSSNIIAKMSITKFLPLLFPDSKKKYSRPLITFDIKSPMLNVDEFLPEPKKTDKGKQTNSTTMKSEDKPIFAEPLPDNDIRGTLAINKFISNGIELNNVRGTINIINDILSIRYNSGLYGGTANSNLNINMKNINNIIMSSKINLVNIDINKFINNFNDRLNDDTKLNKSVKKADDIVYGKLTLRTDFKGHGRTGNDVRKSLAGTFYGEGKNGKIKSNLLLKKITPVIETISLEKFESIDFRKMNFSGRVENEKVYLDKVTLNSNVGDFAGNGILGFDASYDFKIDDRLTYKTSQNIIRYQNKGKNVAKQGIGSLIGKNSTIVSGLLDGAGIPADRQGRVTVKFGIRGDASNPDVYFIGFGDGVTQKQKKPSDTIKKNIKNETKKLVTQEKRKIEKKAKAVVKQKTKSVKKATKKKIGKTLKGLFK